MLVVEDGEVGLSLAVGGAVEPAVTRGDRLVLEPLFRPGVQRREGGRLRGEAPGDVALGVAVGAVAGRPEAANAFAVGLELGVGASGHFHAGDQAQIKLVRELGSCTPVDHVVVVGQSKDIETHRFGVLHHDFDGVFAVAGIGVYVEIYLHSITPSTSEYRHPRTIKGVQVCTHE
mgnify:CR=1 FL=1